MAEQLKIDEKAFLGTDDDYTAIKEAVIRLSAASQDQFESIKKESWFTRFIDMVTFSQKGEKRLADQISTVAQAQQILIEVLLRLSTNDAKISQIVCESLDDIKRLQEQNIYLLTKIKRLEDISLGIKPDMDVSKLSEKEKKVLSSCLYYLNQNSDVSSDEQKTFANLVISYINVDVQMDNPISAIEEMNVDSKRRILACCMEYMYLKDCSTKNWGEYEDFIENFDIGNKTIKSLEKQIEALHSLRGLDGFYSKYKSEEFDKIDDYFELEIDSIENDEHVNNHDVQLVDEANCIGITDASIIPNKGDILPKYEVNKVLTIKEDTTIEGKEVLINSQIHLYASLDFDNCIIHINEQNISEIKVYETGNGVRFDNCLIVSGEKNGGELLTIDNEEASGFLGARNCIFENCGTIFKYDQYGYDEDIFLNMKHCNIINCKKDFVLINANYGNEDECYSITNCLFSWDEKYELSINDNENFLETSCITIHSTGTVSNTNFINNSKQPVPILIGSNDITESGTIINGCEFINCQIKISCKKLEYNKFERCTTPSIEKIEVWGDINNCSFADYEHLSIECSGKKITNCSFANITFSAGIIEAQSNVEIKHCTFEKCVSESYGETCPFFLMPSTIIEVESCDFVNYESDDLIPDRYRYRTIYGLFGREKGQEHCIKVSNCLGIRND